MKNTYIIRNKKDKQVSGCIEVKNEKELFDNIDEICNPFDFEFYNVDPRNFWIDSSAKWLAFKQMASFHDMPTLTLAE